MPLDTLAYARTLEAAGLPRAQAAIDGLNGTTLGDGPCVSMRHANLRGVESHGARDGKDARPDKPRTRQHRCCRRQHACSLRRMPTVEAQQNQGWQG